MVGSRKLAAILAADVVGFSRLAGVDEERTLARLRALRGDVVDPSIAVHNGRVVKRTGDGALVEFRSAVDAVRCGVEIQQAMIERNQGAPNDRRIEFRIGIHVGDVVEEDDGDLMGDGVNVAARLEGLAEPNGVCLSEDAYRQVKARIGLPVDDLGAKTLKNIAEPIRVFAIRIGGPGGGATPRATKPAPAAASRQKPSIAVLPFVNASDDPKQEYFSDGISEDIITDLSKLGGLMVISRNSSFTYKGRPVDVRTVGRDLGVHSVLEGSVRRAGARVRITAQLVDAESGAQVWAERYDRDVTDLFELQDEVTRQIVAALRVNLTSKEKARLGDGGTASLEAYDHFLRGREFLYGEPKSLAKFETAVEEFNSAISLDPNYAQAYAGLGWAYVFDYQNGWTADRDQSLALARRNADVAVEKDANEPAARFALFLAAAFEKDFERASAEAQMAVTLNPNFALGYNSLGTIRLFAGEPMAAVPLIEQAMRLDPAWTKQYLHFLGVAYLVAGKYETAAAIFRQRIIQAPETDFSRAGLTSALGHLGEFEEARRVWRELMEINPKYTFSGHFGRQPFRRAEDLERIAQGLRLAGLPAD